MCFAKNDGVCECCKAQGELVKFGNGWVCEDCLDGINYSADIDPSDCSENGLWDDMDGDFDSAMASAGYGTDEDYGGYDGFDYDFNMHTEGE